MRRTIRIAIVEDTSGNAASNHHGRAMAHPFRATRAGKVGTLASVDNRTTGLGHIRTVGQRRDGRHAGTVWRGQNDPATLARQVV